MKRNKITPVLSRKEREKHARQQEILKAARELFASKGYHNTTLEEIAHHAEFGKGTIYNYFNSKEELFYGIIDQLTSETLALAQSAVNGSGGGAREKLTAYARAMVSHARDNADLFHLVMREIHRLNSEEFGAGLKLIGTRARKVWEITARPIAEEIRAQRIKPINPLKLAALFDGMVRIHCLNLFEKYRSPEGRGMGDSIEFVVSVFFDGVAERKLKG